MLKTRDKQALFLHHIIFFMKPELDPPFGSASIIPFENERFIREELNGGNYICFKMV